MPTAFLNATSNLAKSERREYVKIKIEEVTKDQRMIIKIPNTECKAMIAKVNNQSLEIRVREEVLAY